MGKLLDISVSDYGANILIENLGVNSVYFAGMSYPNTNNYYDIGVL